MTTKKPTYVVNVKCDNCDYVGEALIPKGKPLNGPVQCPNCECNTARKHNTINIPHITKPYWPPPVFPCDTVWINTPQNDPPDFDPRPFPRITCEEHNCTCQEIG